MNDRSAPQRLSNLLKHLRGDRNDSEFAASLGVARDTMLRWESGQGLPRGSKRKLTAALGCKQSDLDRYLNGEISLEVFLQAVGGANVEDRLTTERVLSWLVLQSPIVFAEILRTIARTLRSQERVVAGILMTLADLIREEPSRPPLTILQILELELKRSPWADKDDPVAALQEALGWNDEEWRSAFAGERLSEFQLMGLSMVTGRSVDALLKIQGANGQPISGQS